MRALLLVSAIVATMLACGGDDDGSDAPDAAAQRRAVDAVAFLQGEGATPPVIGESYDCGIYLPGSTPVPGRCLWTAVEEPPNWIVTFRETWSCNQFATDADGFPACTNVTGFHEWVYEVDLVTGGVEQTDETGQFPPEYTQ